jgi:hypothetical protein
MSYPQATESRDPGQEKRSIEEALGVLNKTVDLLTERISCLHERTKTITLPVHPPPQEKLSVHTPRISGPGSVIREAIYVLVGRITDCTERVQTLLSNLDLP